MSFVANWKHQSVMQWVGVTSKDDTLAVVFYDGSCPLCQAASRIAQKNLERAEFNVVKIPIQLATKRDIMDDDEFLLVIGGKIMRSHMAWWTMLSLKRPPLKWLAWFSRFSPLRHASLVVYNVVSKGRKGWFSRGKKSGCGCGK